MASVFGRIVLGKLWVRVVPIINIVSYKLISQINVPISKHNQHVLWVIISCIDDK